MIKSEQIDKLAAALAKAQGAIEDADKDSTNPHFKSKYSDFASVRAAVRKPLSENGLCYVQLPRTGDKVVEVETVLMHESGQFIGETLTIPPQGMTAHAIGSALTYAKRYGLMAVVGLASSEDDDDGNEATRPQHHVAQRSAPKREEARPQAQHETPFDEAPAAPGADLKHLLAMGDEAADRGLDVLQTWWRGRTKEERKAVGEGRIAEWKVRASAADGVMA